MELTPLYIQVLPRLSRTGSIEHLEGVYEFSRIEIGSRCFDLSGIDYNIDLTNTGEAVLLTGQASAELNTSCDRCLQPAKLDITGETQGYFLFEKESVEDTDGLEVHEEVDRDGRIDIAPALLAAIVIELPTVTLCRPECEGIAPAAEAGEQGAEDKAEDTPPASPFAALKDFKFDE